MLIKCISCNKENQKHQAKGLCKTCYNKEWFRKKTGFIHQGWSRHYAQCIECKSSKNRYESNGFCCKCYSRNRRRKQSGFAPSKSGWSLRYECCKECSTTTIKPQGNGLCKKCYTAHYRADHPEKFKEHRILLKNKLKFLSASCELCYSKDKIEVHHICPEKFLADRGITDPEILHGLKNLMPVCAACHRYNKESNRFLHKIIPQLLWNNYAAQDLLGVPRH